MKSLFIIATFLALTLSVRISQQGALLTNKRVPGLNLAETGSRLSGACWKRTYGRGVGVVPDPYNGCVGSTPDYDWGLCYPNCEAGYDGVGPVCW